MKSLPCKCQGKTKRKDNKKSRKTVNVGKSSLWDVTVDSVNTTSGWNIKTPLNIGENCKIEVAQGAPKRQPLGEI